MRLADCYPVVLSGDREVCSVQVAHRCRVRTEQLRSTVVSGVVSWVVIAAGSILLGVLAARAIA